MTLFGFNPESSSALLQNPDMLTRKIKLCHINAHITCRLCEGYLIDATTVTECLHTCRSHTHTHTHCCDLFRSAAHLLFHCRSSSCLSLSSVSLVVHLKGVFLAQKSVVVFLFVAQTSSTSCNLCCV